MLFNSLITSNETSFLGFLRTVVQSELVFMGRNFFVADSKLIMGPFQ